MPGSTPTLIFLHIPKAAGSTLSSVVWRQYLPGEVFDVYGMIVQDRIQALSAMDEVEKRQIRCVIGHVRFGVHSLLPQPCRYVTMLRDPVERVISSYYYIKRQPKHWLHKEVQRGTLSLEAFARDEDAIAVESRNMQTRMLSNVCGAERVSEEHLKKAMHNLEEGIAAVGLTERFDESLLLFQAVLGWRNHLLYLRKNVTLRRPIRDAVSSDAIKAIREGNRLDLELYDRARAIFALQYARAVSFPSIRLASLRWRNRAYNLIQRPSR